MMTARDVAEYLLRLSDTEANDMTNLKLQKLVYYVQGFHLAVHGSKLFEELIEPWQYGPVVAALYHEYKGGRNSIILPTSDYAFSGTFTPEQEELMQEVYDVYGQYSGIKLMHLTHEELPWVEANRNGAAVIDTDTMRTFFKEQLVHE